MAEPDDLSVLPPGAAPAETGKIYIGVQDNAYRGPGRASVNDRSAMEAEARGVYRQRGGVEPRYKIGAERSLLAGQSPERVAALQQQLVDAGLLTGTSFRFGVWDDTSATAFRQVLSYANNEGMDAGRALSEMRSNAAMFPQPQLDDPASTRAPLTTQLTDPADLVRAFRSTVQQLTGRVDEDYVQSLVSAYQQREAGVQSQAYGMAETGGTYTAPPSPTAFAEEQTRKDLGTEVGAADMANTFKDFLGVIGTLGSG